jgi:Rhodanese-related sulfurtransferase
MRAGLAAAGLAVAACAGHGTPARATGPVAKVAPALPRLVSTEELARWRAEPPPLLLDIRTDVFAYLKGHLPGAEYLNSETLRASEGGIPTRLLSGEEYRELFSRLGVAPDRPVVIYSAGESRNIERRSWPGCWPASAIRRCTYWMAASSSGSSSSGPWCSPIPGFR